MSKSTPRAAGAATLALLVVLVAGCAGEATTDTTPTPAATASPRVLPTKTKAPDGTPIESAPNPSAPLPPPRIERRAGLWLVDLPSSRVHMLYDVAIGANFEYWGPARFAPDGTLWVEPFDPTRLPEHISPDGTRLALAPSERPPWSDLRCVQPDHGVERAIIEGREYAANCGVLSPDGRVMTWRGRPATEFDFEAPLPVFLLDLATGASKRLPPESRSGAGDFFWGDAWSPSGAFVILHWWGDRVAHLADRQGNVRLVAAPNEFLGRDRAMQWSPREDAYLSPGLEGGPFIEWPATGRRLEVPNAVWPVRFDTTGAFVYWAVGPAGERSIDLSKRATATTVAASTDTGQEVARWPWLPSAVNAEDRGIAAFEGAPVAVLELSEDLGLRQSRYRTRVEHPLLAAPLVLEGALGAVWSPDARSVAYARADFVERRIPATELTGAARIIDNRWVIEVLDIGTGTSREVTRVPQSDGPPLIEWNPTGAALLVSFPPPSGI